MNHRDVTEIIGRIFIPILSDHLKRHQDEVAELRARLAAVEAISVEKGERGEPGEQGPVGAKGECGLPGESVDPDLLAHKMAAIVDEPLKGFLTGLVEKKFELLTTKVEEDKKLLVKTADELVDETMPVIQFMVDKAVAQLPPPPMGPPGQDGKDGAAVTIAEIEPILESLVTRAVADIPKPRDGEVGPTGPPGPIGPTGRDGAAVTIAEVEPVLESLVQRAVAELPRPADGPAGEPGPQGPIGPPGLAGIAVTIAEVEPVIETLVNRAVAELPRPADGKDGADGTSVTVDDVAPLLKTLVEQLPPPKDGADGAPGADGIGLAGLVIDRDGRLTATLSDGTMHQLGQVVGRDGAAGMTGKDGRDGVSLSDLNFEQLDDRSLRITMASGELVKTIDWRLPVPIYKGIYDIDRSYQRGDEVTFGGQVYIASKDAPTTKPGEGRDWDLRARKGRDGRDGAPGTPGERGPAGPATPPPRDFGRHET